MVDDSPIEYPVGKSGKTWKPDNYDRKFRGPITLQQALEESINVAAVKVQEQVGIRRTVEVARRLGVESPLDENLSIALGTSDLTLLELTSAYGALANQGTWMRADGHPLRARRAAQARSRRTLPQGKQVLSPEIAFVTTHMLRGTIERGHRRRRQGPGATRRGQDRHDQRLLQCVVRRLHAHGSPRGYGSATTGREAWAATRPAPASRCRSGRPS